MELAFSLFGTRTYQYKTGDESYLQGGAGYHLRPDQAEILRCQGVSVQGINPGQELLPRPH